MHYNAAGQPISDQLGDDGEVGTYTYTNRNQLQAMSAVNGSTPIYNYSLTFAPNGNVLTANDSVNGNWNYSYDQFNRLVCANLASNGTCATPPTGTPTYTYVYDRYGNRWQQNGSYSMQLSFTGNGSTNNNRMDGYSHDSAGNLMNDGTHQYFYDAENRLTQVDGAAGTYTSGSTTGTTACYYYDAEGHRVWRTGFTADSCDNTGKRGYVFDLAGHVIVENNSNGTGCQGQVYVGERHFGRQSGGTFFYHADWLGTVRFINSDGYPTQGAETCTSLPFGDGQTCNSTYGNVWHFTGKERDSESGLDNFVARFNSSSMGRFMSADPIGGQNIDPQTLNKYSYVRNNPINFTDPTGLYTCKDDNNKCETKKDIDFEKARQRDLKSKNKDVARAAKAFDDPKKDNHVSVGFANLDNKGEGGDTKSTLGAEVGADGKANLFAQSDVTINSNLSGTALDAAIGHEGSHVADAQDVVNSIAIIEGGKNFQLGQDITRYQSEQRAYAVTDSILKSGNENWHFACGFEDCILGTGLQLLALRPDVIGRLMAGSPLYRSNGQPLSPTNQGGSVVNGVVVPH